MHWLLGAAVMTGITGGYFAVYWGVVRIVEILLTIYNRRQR